MQDRSHQRTTGSLINANLALNRLSMTARLQVVTRRAGLGSCSISNIKGRYSPDRVICRMHVGTGSITFNRASQSRTASCIA